VYICISLTCMVFYDGVSVLYFYRVELCVTGAWKSRKYLERSSCRWIDILFRHLLVETEGNDRHDRDKIRTRYLPNISQKYYHLRWIGAF
jgi:hypothetical protein